MAKLLVDRRARRYRHKSRHDGATDLLSLPQEALLEIGAYLNLPCIEALSATCRRLHEAFVETLRKDQAFARESLRDLTLTTNDYGYHDFLLQILKREINPNYVKKLDCSEACHYYCQPFHNGEEEIDVAQYIGWTPEEIQLIRKTIAKSPWLKDIIYPDDLIAKMLEGNEEAVLVLLIPLLKNLSIFLPPGHIELLPKVFTRIARVQLLVENENSKALEQVPLRRLHTVYAGGRGMSLAEIVQYMSLPSVKRGFIAIISYSGNDTTMRANLRNLMGIPRSRASAVYMWSGDTWRDVAELLAEFFHGPCTIRQYLDEPVPSDTEMNEAWVAVRLTGYRDVPEDPLSYFWDHCIISRDRRLEITSHGVTRREHTFIEDPEYRTVEFKLKYRAFHYEGGREAGRPIDDMERYEDAIRRAGEVPSPQWLALARWERGLVRPGKLDDDTFMLEE